MATWSLRESWGLEFNQVWEPTHSEPSSHSGLGLLGLAAGVYSLGFRVEFRFRFWG